MSTEANNPNSQDLDQLSSLEFVQLCNQEDHKVLEAINKAAKDIAKAIDIVADSLKDFDPNKEGHRLFYIGAGTSGRLGILDASECPPTFGAHPAMIQGVIAGGDHAIKNAVEGAEDDTEAGAKWAQENLQAGDILIGISASGNAPYVVAALKTAQELNLQIHSQAENCNKISTIAIANNPNAQSFKHSDYQILLDTGAEVLAGSTRLKAGTAQKLTLNMISTGAMLKLNKSYGNLMVDLKATNTKLKKRALDLVQTISKCSEKEAQEALEATDYKVKNAVLKIKQDLSLEDSEALLKSNRGSLRNCLLNSTQ